MPESKKVVLFIFEGVTEKIALQNESRELSNTEKTDMAFDFALSYQGKENDFVTLLNDSNIKVDGSFGQTWSFIQKDNNSLHRHSNFHLAFEDFI